MIKERTYSGITTTIFIIGLIAAILTSTAISVAVTTQLAKGPHGEQGEKGLAGATGATGATGTQGLQCAQGLPGILNPDYDSGWILVNDRIVIQFNHSLGTSDVFVYALCKWYRNWTDSGSPTVHQFYCWVDWHGDPEQMQGFYWDCYTENLNMIEVSQYSGRADETRVLIWKLPQS